jgi:hypothetical protein
MRAVLVRYEKYIIRRRYLVELTVHQVSDSDRYPDGLKWGLVCIDQRTNRQVLMDNHHPKGPHVHVDDHEVFYEYVDLDQLVTDFKGFVLEHIGVRL